MDYGRQNVEQTRTHFTRKKLHTCLIPFVTISWRPRKIGLLKLKQVHEAQHRLTCKSSSLTSYKSSSCTLFLAPTWTLLSSTCTNMLKRPLNLIMKASNSAKLSKRHSNSSNSRLAQDSSTQFSHFCTS